MVEGFRITAGQSSRRRSATRERASCGLGPLALTGPSCGMPTPTRLESDEQGYHRHRCEHGDDKGASIEFWNWSRDARQRDDRSLYLASRILGCMHVREGRARCYVAHELGERDIVTPGARRP